MVQFGVVLVIFGLAVFTAAEVEDVDPQKRGVSKGPVLNTIPINQKPEQFNYYQQTQQQLGPVYTPQAQYYSNVQQQVGNPQPYQNYVQQDPQTYQQVSPAAPVQQQVIPYQYPGQYVQNPGYQRIQIIPLKSGNGQLQISLIPQQSYLSPPPIAAQSTFAPNHYATLPSSPAQYNIPQTHNFYQQPYQFGNPYAGQASSIFMLAQPTAQHGYQFGSPFYSSAAQNLLNYFNSNPQAKQQLLFGSQQPPNTYQGVDYDKNQVQSLSKDDNEISASGNDYASAEPQANSYKRPTYNT